MMDAHFPKEGLSPDFPLFDSQESEATFLSSAFEPINTPDSAQASSNAQTVSPQDLFLDTMSAPPSSAITNLSTPGTYSIESPFVAMSNDTSPIYGTSSMYSNEPFDEDTKEWDSLFPTENPVFNGNDFVHDSDEYPNTEMAAPPLMSRNRSSPGQSSSRGSHQGRHSSSSGVNAKKRDKPLPPIIVDDPSDVIAVKRARNTAAARKSRQKKMERFDELEATIADLQSQVDHWKSIALARNEP